MMATIKNIWKGASTHKGMKFSIFILTLWVIIALSAPFIESIFGISFSELRLEYSLLPPLSTSEGVVHLLGTDYLGRDLFLGLVHGARVALVVAVVSVFMSLLLGLPIGLLIGYYGDHGIKKNIVQQLLILVFVVFGGYYFISMISDELSIYNGLPFLLLIIMYLFLDRMLRVLPIKKYGVPLDLIVQRLFELREGIPGLFIILSVAAVLSSQSIFSVAIIIAILYWMTFARHARAETLLIKEENYVLSAHSGGVSDARLLFYHILPNAMPSIYVIIAFTFGAVIFLESSLSFLGIGMPLEEVSWGKILAGARKHPKAWWLAVFPGLAIFLVLYAFNNLADYFAQYQRRSDTFHN